MDRHTHTLRHKHTCNTLGAERINGFHMVIDLSIQLLHSQTEDKNTTFVYAAVNGELV